MQRTPPDALHIVRVGWEAAYDFIQKCITLEPTGEDSEGRSVNERWVPSTLCVQVCVDDWAREYGWKYGVVLYCVSVRLLGSASLGFLLLRVLTGRRSIDRPLSS